MNIMICATQFKGGSLQVIISLINEFKKFVSNEYHIIIGEEVSKQIKQENFPINFHFYDFPYSGPISYKTKRSRAKLFSKWENQIKPDCVLTSSGPLYWKSNSPMIMGYNLPNNIYGESPFFNKLSISKRIQWWIKKQVHRYYFKKEANTIFVQTDDVNIRVKKYLSLNNVYTISNTVSSFFLNPKVFPNKLPSKRLNEIRLLTVSTWYPHKNFEIIIPVLNELHHRGINNVIFVTTLKNEHFKKVFKAGHKNVINIGPIDAAECPSLYNECDYMFLPTLLECFSASYAEAMIMEKPILTSNLGFATTVCDEAALYFNPLDPSDIADKISLLINNPEICNELIKKEKMRISIFGTAENRAKQILELCANSITN